jgi:hypothetical protein
VKGVHPSPPAAAHLQAPESPYFPRPVRGGSRPRRRVCARVCVSRMFGLGDANAARKGAYARTLVRACVRTHARTRTHTQCHANSMACSQRLVRTHARAVTEALARAGSRTHARTRTQARKHARARAHMKCVGMFASSSRAHAHTHTPARTLLSGQQCACFATGIATIGGIGKGPVQCT